MDKQPNSYSFGSILKEYREEHDMSQQELADILGTTKQVISRYETGQREPKIKIAQQYAEKLNIPLSRLLDGSIPLSKIASPFDPGPLIEQRKTQGLSVEQAAKKCDLSSDVYKSIEDGTIYPTDVQAQQIAMAFRTSLDSLYSLEFYLATPPNGSVYIKLDETEYTLLLKFRELTPSNKVKIIGHIDCIETDVLSALSEPEQQLLRSYRDLNDEGQAKLTSYSYDLVSSGNYIKSDSSELGQKQA